MWYEYIVVTLAATLAGIGKGLVGLSAATAMVPLMIVLCPTFGGDHGAYMATAIALASDILGSAVTTGVYVKNKKIDLKHRWLIAACIIGMCKPEMVDGKRVVDIDISYDFVGIFPKSLFEEMKNEPME